MLLRIASRAEVPDGTMHVFDIAGTRVNVTNTNGRLYAEESSP
jgi:hypothetical protein